MNNLQLGNLLKLKLNNFNLSDSYGHRAVGDKLEADVSNIISEVFKHEFVNPKSKRSIDDFSLVTDNNISLFDVKTHFIQNTMGFSMPNLISVKRLKDVLENDLQTLSYVFIDYKRENGNVLIEDVHIKYIWELDWSILGIGALGKGQLQIKNANKALIFTNIGKDDWFEILKVKVIEFYKKEIIKINKEIKIWQ
jgi:hypothetical protein